MLQSRHHRNHQNHFIRLKISDNTLTVLLSLSTPNKYLLWEQIVENSVRGEKRFITNKISISGTLPFVTINDLTGICHRTTMDKYGKIRMTTVKLKNELILISKNLSNIMAFILKQFLCVNLIYS